MQDNLLFYWILGRVSGASVLIPFVTALFLFSRIKSFLIPIFLLILASVLMELTSYITLNMGIKNSLLYHVFTVVEISFLIFFYFEFLKAHVSKYIVLLAIPVFLVVAYVDFRIHGLDSIDSFSVSIESIILSLFSLTSFFIIMKKMLFEKILAAPFFWINTAVLLYFSGNLFLFVFSNYLHSSKEASLLAMWTIHSFLNIVYNILISIGFWKTRTR